MRNNRPLPVEGVECNELKRKTNSLADNYRFIEMHKNA